MESSSSHPTRAEALAHLEDAERARATFAAGLVQPLGYDVILGLAVAVQIATAAVGLTRSESWAGLVVFGGVTVFGLAAGVQMLRFRRRNGAWLGRFGHQATLGVTPMASIGYGAAFAAAVIAANAHSWWLVGVFAGCGGIAWSVSSVRWMRRYRSGNAAASAGISRRATVALSLALAVLTAMLLVVGHL